MNPPPRPASTYLDHLPAVFREETEGDPGFLGRFLLAFEHVLTGVGDPCEPGLDERVDRVLGGNRPPPGAEAEAAVPAPEADPCDPPVECRRHPLKPGVAPTYFDPLHTPAAFLDWLSGWVAFPLRGDLDAGDGQRCVARGLVADAVRIYRRRGTRDGVRDLITLLAGLPPTITEPPLPPVDDAAPPAGTDPPDAAPPHSFHVLLCLPHADPEERRRVVELVRAVVDVEKPAHTVYQLDVFTPAMQIGKQSRVGVDTLLVPARTPGAPR